jgi:hypothetical protein
MPNIVNGLGQVKVGVKPTPPPPSSLLTSLYSVYKAENNTNDFYGTINGTAMGGLTYTTGKSGQAFNLNGTTSYIDYGDNFDLGLSSWTYSIWYYPTNLGFTRTLFSKTAWAAGGGRYHLQVQSALIVFAITLNNGNNITIRDNSNVLSGDRWCHITIVVDRNDKINIYYNGILSTNVVNLGTATNDLTPYINDNMNNTRPFRIGCSSGTNGFNPETPTNFVQGRLDEFNIWNRALTASEVAQIYNSGSGKFYPY